MKDKEKYVCSVCNGEVNMPYKVKTEGPERYPEAKAKDKKKPKKKK